jgi:iron complex transport system permease protein
VSSPSSTLDRTETDAPSTPHARPLLRDGRVLHPRIGPLSARVDGRAVFVSTIGTVIVLFGVALSVAVGDVQVRLWDVVREIGGFETSTKTEFVVNRLRFPRALTGMLVGAAFGLSGQLFQRLVRNPLASPDIIVVTAGSAFGAVFCIVVASTATTTVTSSALAGSVLTIVAIYLLAIRQGISSYRLVLVGIGMTAMLQAGVAYLLTRAELRDAQRAYVWLTGSLNGRSWEYVRPLSLALLILLPLAMLCSRSLRVLEMGDDCAAGLGVSTARSKVAIGMIGAALAAVGTAAAGPVAFVALLAPQIARRLVGERTPGLVPAAIVGAAMVVYGDLVARRLFAPTELPVGVVTAIVGAPFLLWLLARANRVGTGG